MSGTKDSIGLCDQDTNPLDNIFNDNYTIAAGANVRVNEMIDYII